MNRYRSYFPLDDVPAPDGDGLFRGVNALGNPATLESGLVEHALNMRFEDGMASTRGGIRIMPWGCVGGLTPYGSVLVGERFQDPIGGREWIISVTASGSYKARAGSTASAVPVAAGVSLEGTVDLVQTYNGMVALRGRKVGAWLEDVGEGWKALPSPDVGREAMPPATFGLYHGNRLLLVDARTSPRYVDSVWVSDFGGVTSVLQGSSAYQSFKINQGTADRLNSLHPLGKSTILCGKSASIWAVSGFSGTNEQLALNAELDNVTTEYGCRSPRSWVTVGADAWFLAHERGVASIRQTEQNALQGVDVPVSRRIQRIINRINWEAADRVVAANSNNRVYFAVPIDGARDNNAILVYSLLTGEWAGYDQSDATAVRDFVVFPYGGATRLGFVSQNGYVCLLDDGAYDHTGDALGNVTYHEIRSELRTRGYAGTVKGRKRFTRAEWSVMGWRPAFEVSVVREGVNERTLVASRAPDRVKYDAPAGTPDWNPSNISGDWANPGRQDYSVDISTPTGLRLDNGLGVGTVAYDVFQTHDDGVGILEHSRSLQVEIVNTQGRIKVTGISVDSERGDTSDGRKT